MVDDIKKSFNSILYERTTSPFFGTLILSWTIWNWRIIYLTIFISEDKIKENKIDFIVSNYCKIHNLTTFPLISSLLLLTVIPFISNGAYWLSLKFDKWKKDQKNKVEMKQLLTVEQSIDLREQISKQEERFEKLLEYKNNEIKQLNLIIEDYRNSRIETKIKETITLDINQKELIDLSEKIKTNSNQSQEYEALTRYIQGSYKVTGTDKISTNIISLLESHDIITNIGNGIYKFTEKGKQFQRLMIN